MPDASEAARRLALLSHANRWSRVVDPNGELPPDERDRRITEAKQEYYRELGRRSGAARRARAQQREGEAA